MGTISLSLPSDGQTIDAADVNTPFNTVAAVINGNIDDDNVKSGANINGSKLLDASIPGKKFDTTTYGGWVAGVLPAVSSVAALGNRSYNVTFASTVAAITTPGQRMRFTPTVAPPTKCTDLESGSTQYYSKASPAGMTFTDDFVVSAWVKLESYVNNTVAARYNGTSGWSFDINTSGQVRLIGFKAGGANFSQVLSYQSVPLNKWVHIAAQLDMSTFTATTTTSYVMIDGVDVPAAVSRGGTNPTDLTQPAADLNIGAYNGGSSPFDGKLAQVAIYSAKVTQATILASINQTLSGSETSLISAYSFNNSITDLNTSNANNLSAQGSAVATDADSPFGVDATGTPGIYDYGIVTKVATTVATVQVPEANTIPTSGGVSAVDLSAWKAPFGMPVSKNKWKIGSLWRTSTATTSNATYGAFSSAGWALTAPIGEWDIGWCAGYVYNAVNTTVTFNISSTALTGMTLSAGNNASPYAMSVQSAAAAFSTFSLFTSRPQSIAAAVTYVMYTLGATTSAAIEGGQANAEIFAEFNLL